jgi:type II secretory pathway pseudopilin PulG
MLKRREQRGDTIIEVLFAITIFSLVAVGSLSLMNQGATIAQRALEIGLVRQQIDTQTDALRYLNSVYIENFGKADSSAKHVWDTVVTGNKQVAAQDFDTVATSAGCKSPSDIGSSSSYRPFALNVAQLKDALDPDPTKSNSALGQLVLKPTNEDTATYAKVGESSDPHTPGIEAQGIWVEAVQAPANTDFYDFHITACWTSPGQAVPVKLGTIVRLYVPHS